ncbi:MAG TPA: 3-phosphoshikimate 1-carboxyvinyltransferase [Acidimicrobiales bacterium]|nr:3-phosphoshikimate 1-carboxyvinyltransferase [Acidimicrobiales bacterium]
MTRSAAKVFTTAASGPLRGRLRVPGDKSISHRALMLAAVAEGVSRVRGLSDGDDVARTARAIRAMGAEVDGERISGGTSRLHEPDNVIDVGNSGTGIRLLAGLCAGLPWLTVLTGDASIRTRPMDRVSLPLRQMGATVDGRAGGRLPPLMVRGGGLHGIDYAPPVASAQVKSAVLLAGLSAQGETVVREVVATRGHTEELLKAAGADISIHRVGGGRVVRLKPSRLRPLDVEVPGDPSQAAFWVVAACLVPKSDVVVENVYVGPGRATFLDVLQRMGADVTVENREGTVGDIHARHSKLSGTVVAGEEIPGLQDEIPVLAVAALMAEGTTVFRDAAELRVKETDRLAALSSELAEVGGRVESLPDGLIVHGGPAPAGGRARSHGDHRVAMAMAVAGLAAREPLEIEGWDAVATSYPGFGDDLARLAG